MKRSNKIAALASAAALTLGLAGAGTASAHGNTGFLCYGNGSNLPMYGDGPGQGPVDWALQYGEAFRGLTTTNVGGVFWSLGHSASSYPNDYWIRTNYLRC